MIRTEKVSANNTLARFDTEANRIWWGGEHAFDQTFPDAEQATVAWMMVTGK